MPHFLKQSTAVTIKLGPFLDDTDGNTPETALTINQADVRVSKNGGNFAQKNEASAASHDELGYYNVPIDATDTGTLGRILIAVHVTGALPVWKEFTVLPANSYDSLIAGSDKLEVDAIEISGDGPAADALEAMLDGTRAKLYLSQLDIEASGTDDAVKIIADPTNGGNGILVEGGGGNGTGGSKGLAIFSNDGNGVLIGSGGALFPALYISGGNTGALIQGDFEGARIQASDDEVDGHGLVVRGRNSGYGCRILNNLFIQNEIFASTINSDINGTINSLTPPNQIFVDAANGNDANDGSTWANAKATLTAAKNAAAAGTTIIVAAGSYNENNLLKDGVNWHFHAGAIVNHNTGAAAGIFDDGPNGANGAIKSRITGYAHLNATTEFPGFIIHIENTDSYVEIEADAIGELQNTTEMIEGAVYLSNGTLKLKCPLIDIFALSNTFTFQVDGGNLDLIGNSKIGDALRNNGGIINIYGDILPISSAVESVHENAITNIYNSNCKPRLAFPFIGIHAQAGKINAFNTKVFANTPATTQAAVTTTNTGKIFLSNCTVKNYDAQGLDILNDGGEVVVTNTDYDTTRTLGTITFAPGESGGGATPAEVKAKILEALTVDEYEEPVAAPPATATIEQKIAWLYARARNPFIQTAIDQTLRNLADTANIAQRTITADPTQAKLDGWE